MANTAFISAYRQETIDGFEQSANLLRAAVTTEAIIKGSTATFLVADTNNDTTVTRGVNGQIPYRSLNLNQYTATLTEEHGAYEATGYNIFASQGDLRMSMQKNAIKPLNRAADSKILTALSAATLTTGTAAPASLQMVTRSLGKLGTNGVPLDGNVFGVISPYFYAYISAVKEFASADYVDNKPLGGDSGGFSDGPKMFEWQNVKWIVSPLVDGVGTSSESCYLFHKSAIGFAVNSTDMQVQVGYDEKQDSSWTRASAYMGAKLLQNSGIIKMVHDSSGISI